MVGNAGSSVNVQHIWHSLSSTEVLSSTLQALAREDEERALKMETWLSIDDRPGVGARACC